MTNIPIGYQLHVHTWENDWDHLQIKIINGLSEEDTKFYIELLSYFKIDDDYQDKITFGNETPDKTQLLEVIEEVLKNNPNISIDLKKDWETGLKFDKDESDNEKFNGTLNLVIPILGFPDEFYDYGFCRVCEMVQVFYIPQEIEDVTDKFK